MSARKKRLNANEPSDSPCTPSCKERTSDTLPSLDESVKKRVRVALLAGNIEAAKSEIRSVVPDEEDVEALYLKHLAEEEERENQEHYESVRNDEDALLALMMDGLQLDKIKESVLCPVCEHGELDADTFGIISCRKCAVRFSEYRGSLDECRQILAESFDQHSLQCEEVRPKFLVVPSKTNKTDNILVMTCDVCHMNRVVF